MMRKIVASHVFDGEKFLRENTLLILDKGGYIEDICEGVSSFGDDVFLLNEGIVCPGFVNAHCHLELSYLQGKIPRGTGMVSFIERVLSTKKPTVDELQQSLWDADLSMWNAGIQAVGDIVNTAITTEVKQQSKILYHTFIELIDRAEDAVVFEEMNRLQASFTALKLKNTIVPHAPYSVTPTQFRQISEWASSSPICMHYNESQEEQDFMKNKQGNFVRFFSTISPNRRIWRTSYNEWLDLLDRQTRLILVHSTLLDAEDIHKLQKHQSEGMELTFCLCPQANQYIHGTVPPLRLLQQSGLPICLGTDSLASNDSLSILEEMKCLQAHFPEIETAKLLQFATSAGAKALGIEKEMGYLRKGKNAGLVHIVDTEGKKIKPSSSVVRIH